MNLRKNLRFLAVGLRTAASDPSVKVLMGLVTALIVVATVFYRLVEQWAWIDALYFAVVTIATVGYGDLVPQTVLGKLFTIIYILMGIGLFVAFAAALTQRVVGAARPR
ncbi:MAG: potassium channel family protein [Rhodobacterales bacterium]|nr:potassium channel family protein [Rhodobacterales bacterium]MDX5413161.1 potassium channel family protein [Rhodobacterales bacterium]